MTLDFSRIAQDLQIRKIQVENVVQLLDEGNTVPFITRYRKERTGGLNEDVIRKIQGRVNQLRQLAERKQTILKSIEGQGKLTDDLRNAILAADTSKRLEDLYLPYKPKKRSLATAARERGLEPLALAIWNRDPAITNLNEFAATMVNPEKELPTPVEVLLGAQHILAEQIADTADIRAAVRSILWETGRLATAKAENLPEGQGLEYKDYFQFTEPVRQIPPHRILAINRGEKEGPLKARLEFDAEAVRQVLYNGFRGRPPLLPLADHPHAEFLKTVAEDALTRLLLPSLEREIRRELTEESQEHAVSVFARNLRSLLLQPPLRGRRVLAVDPGFRTGCKLAALDDVGNLVEDAVIYPHPPQNKKDDAKNKLEELIRKHQLQVIAIGNGTACRETEEVVSELLSEFEKGTRGTHSDAPPAPPPVEAAPVQAEAPVVVEAPPPPAPVEGMAGEAPAAAPVADSSAPSAPPVAPPVVAKPPAVPAVSLASLPTPPVELAYVIINEAGASVYSASPVGREEFPNFDATLRGTISIGRRLQDPLSELVKIDPQNIGVGLYQHDVHPRFLKESLEAVIESCVNHVGVDLNTASVPLLRHVSGLNQLVARELVDYRKQNGPFRTRDQLMQVPNVGEARFKQAAGFLKIVDGDNPLDRTSIHPESYTAAQRLLSDLGYTPEILQDRQKTEELRDKLKSLSPEEISARLEVGVPTLKDILEALGRPGRDPREDLPPPIFKKGILKLEHLQPGMELKGTVLNVVDFGAFIDIGLKDSGLVHISQMANRYVKSPYDVVSVGDVVTVWVMTVDQERRRVSLTMIKPGTERKPPEKKPPQPRPQQQPRPPQPPRSQQQPPPGGRPPQQQQQQHRRPPQRGGRRPAPAQNQPAGSGEAAAAGSGPTPQQRQQGPPPRPRKPHRAVPLPKLSQAALKGAVPLRTFGELEAFFKAGQTPPPEPTPPPAADPTPPSVVEPPPEPVAAVAEAPVSETPVPTPPPE